MRRMILEIELKPPFDEYIRQAMGQAESYNVLEMVRIDFQHGIKVGILEVTMKEGFSLEDLDLPSPAKIVSVIQEEGSTYTGMGTGISWEPDGSCLFWLFPRPPSDESETVTVDARMWINYSAEFRVVVRYEKTLREDGEIAWLIPEGGAVVTPLPALETPEDAQLT